MGCDDMEILPDQMDYLNGLAGQGILMKEDRQRWGKRYVNVGNGAPKTPVGGSRSPYYEIQL